MAWDGRSVPIEETSVKQFQGKQFVNLERIVALTAYMFGDYSLDRISVDEPTLQGPRVEQYFLDVLGQ